MDTIHTLNTSLPASTSRSQDQQHTNHQRQQQQPPQQSQQSSVAAPPAHTTSSSTSNNQNNNSRMPPPPPSLHAAFKAAAFSVAQLYKTAATDADVSRAEGYQDAIDELLAFLDQENLGLGDGEGWRVRQWATERLEPSVYPNAETTSTNAADADSDMKEDQQASQNPKPTAAVEEAKDLHTGERKWTTETTQSTAELPSTTTSPSISTTSTATPDKQGLFHFTANPHDTDMSHHDHFDSANLQQTGRSPTSVRLNLRRASGSRTASGASAGSKRKTPPIFADFFDFGGAFGGMGNPGAFGGGGGSGGGFAGGMPKRGRME